MIPHTFVATKAVNHCDYGGGVCGVSIQYFSRPTFLSDL